MTQHPAALTVRYRNTAGWKKNQFLTFSACTSLSMWIIDPESIEVKAKLPVPSSLVLVALKCRFTEGQHRTPVLAWVLC